jgi:hypothetical protein
MLSIGLDQLLHYLATGEDEARVLAALATQRDVHERLAEAQAALELLSPAGVGEAVAERLRQVERAVQPPPPPTMARSAMAASNFRMERSLSSAESRAPGYAPRRKEPDLPPGLSATIRDGAAQVRRAGTAVLHKPFVKAVPPPRRRAASLPEDSTAYDPGDIDVAGMRLLELPSVVEDMPAAAEPAAGEARFAPRPPPARSAAHFALGPDSSAELSHEQADGADYLRVALRGADADTQPVLVTCIPAAGPVAQAMTDATGAVLLPWPAPGTGVLRIEYPTTVEIRLSVEL